MPSDDPQLSWAPGLPPAKSGPGSSHLLVDGDESVEDVLAPGRVVTADPLGRRVFTGDEAVQHAYTVRESRPPHTHHRRVNTEHHRTCHRFIYLLIYYYPRESFREGLWNHRRTFVCLFVCPSVCLFICLLP